jgi:ribosome-associated heat shock protein Hsp15
LNGRRLDQWLWFARLVKSRSRGARLCAAGAVAVNGVTVTKVDYILRTGETITLRQGAFCRTVRVLAPGERRGPTAEARKLYEETAAPVRLSGQVPAWTPLLMADDESRTIRHETEET